LLFFKDLTLAFWNAVKTHDDPESIGIEQFDIRIISVDFIRPAETPALAKKKLGTGHPRDDPKTILVLAIRP